MVVTLAHAVPDWDELQIAISDGFAPKYIQLAEGLRQLIVDLPEGSSIPSEKELMELAGVGRATARAAVSELVREGLLVARRGLGTFRAPKRIDTDLNSLAGFSETMRKLGKSFSSIVLSATEVNGNKSISEKMNIAAATPLIRIERLRILENQPCMLECTYFIARGVPNLLKHDLSGSLYDLLRIEYNLIPSQGTESILSINADVEISRLLGIKVGGAVLATTRITQTKYGSPLECTLRYARGDLCSFSVSLDSERTSDGKPMGLLAN